MWLGREDEAFTSGSDEVLQGGSIREIASRCSKRKKIKDKKAAGNGVETRYLPEGHRQKSGPEVLIHYGVIIVAWHSESRASL